MGSEVRAAAELAGRMLSPGVLDEGLRSGLFLVRQTESDRWHDFAHALVAELQHIGALVIFIDLGELVAASPRTLQQELHSRLVALRKQLLPMAPAGRGDQAVETLRDLIVSIVDLSRSDTVLIFDQAGRLRGRTGGHTLKSLKAARDAVNLRLDASKRFFLIAVDSDPSAVNEIASDPAQAFFGGTIMRLNCT